MNSDLTVEYWDIEKVIPYANNPRKNEAAIDSVAASIKAYGFRQPIVIDKEGVIIVGHTRYQAARRLGFVTVPVHIDDLSSSEAKGYRLADNRVAEDAEWDFDALRIEIEDIDDHFIGFSESELKDIMFEGKEGNADEDEIPEKKEEVISVIGDVWLLRDHRLVCGDSTDQDFVEKALNGEAPHLMVTDPPYGVEYDPDWRNRVKTNPGTRISGRAIGKVTNDDNAIWTEAWRLFPGDVVYIWHSGLHESKVEQSLIDVDIAIRAQIIWVKNHIVISRGHYHWKHEPCFYGVRNKATAHWNGDRKQSTVWEIDKPMASETGHGTQKPVECMRRPIINNSKIGDIVYEPFCGSGTTIIAAETEGRICYAIELSPEYVDLAIRRWQDFTGEEAVLEGAGKTFNEIAEKGRDQL